MENSQQSVIEWFINTIEKYYRTKNKFANELGIPWASLTGYLKLDKKNRAKIPLWVILELKERHNEIDLNCLVDDVEPIKTANEPAIGYRNNDKISDLQKIIETQDLLIKSQSEQLKLYQDKSKAC